MAHIYFAAGHSKSESDGEGVVLKNHVTNLMKAEQETIENAADFAKACESICSDHNKISDIHTLHSANKQ